MLLVGATFYGLACVARRKLERSAE
jgi:hypothetical protein